MPFYIPKVAKAEIINNLPKPQSQSQESSFGASNMVDFLTWASVFLGILGFLMLVAALFLYLLAAGEEPKMKKGHTVLIGGIVLIVGAIVIYVIGRVAGSNLD